MTTAHLPKTRKMIIPFSSSKCLIVPIKDDLRPVNNFSKTI